MIPENIRTIEFVTSNKRTINCRLVNGMMRITKHYKHWRLVPIECDPKLDNIVMVVTLRFRDDPAVHLFPPPIRNSYVATDGELWCPATLTVTGSKLTWYLHTGLKFNSSIITELTSTDKRCIEKAITLYVSENLE